jgi:uncharacterized protein (UPF0333 family)
MDSKGQLSVEYLLLILVIVIILGAVTIPLVGNSISNSLYVSGASDAKNAVSNIANAANLVYANGPSSKRTINIYMPKYTLQKKNIANTIEIGMPIDLTHFINASTNYDVSMNQTDFTGNNAGWYTVQVYWDLNKTYINIDFNKKIT